MNKLNLQLDASILMFSFTILFSAMGISISSARADLPAPKYETITHQAAEKLYNQIPGAAVAAKKCESTVFVKVLREDNGQKVTTCADLGSRSSLVEFFRPRYRCIIEKAFAADYNANSGTAERQEARVNAHCWMNDDR